MSDRKRDLEWCVVLDHLDGIHSAAYWGDFPDHFDGHWSFLWPPLTLIGWSSLRLLRLKIMLQPLIAGLLLIFTNVYDMQIWSPIHCLTQSWDRLLQETSGVNHWNHFKTDIIGCSTGFLQQLIGSHDWIRKWHGASTVRLALAGGGGINIVSFFSTVTVNKNKQN